MYFCFIDYAKVFAYVDHNKLWKILQEMRITDHLICLLRNLYASQEAGQVVWYSQLLKKFPQFVVIHTVKGFSVVNEAEVDVFSGILLLFLRYSRCWQFDLWFLCLF